MSTGGNKREQLERIHVRDVQLVAINADARDYETLPDDLRVDFGLSDFYWKIIDSGLRARVTAAARFYAREDANHGEPHCEITLLYEVDLDFPENFDEQLLAEDGTIPEILETKVAPYVFPYVREKIHMLSNELPLPVTLIPLQVIEAAEAQQETSE